MCVCVCERERERERRKEDKREIIEGSKKEKSVGGGRLRVRRTPYTQKEI